VKDKNGLESLDLRVPFWKKPQIDRRVFFRHMATAVGGYYLLPSRPMQTIASAAPAPINRARNCIFILMAGAPSHIDTFDFKYIPGVTPASFNPGYVSPGGVNFPQGLLPTIAQRLDENLPIAFLRSFRSWALEHQFAQTWTQIGRSPTSPLAKVSPHIGSVVSRELYEANGILPTFMSLNTGGGPANGYFPPQYAPFFFNPNGAAIPNTSHGALGQPRFESRHNLLLALDAPLRPDGGGGPLGVATDEVAVFNRQARGLMYNPQVNATFALDPPDRTRYDSNGAAAGNAFGNACRTAFQLLNARLGTRFVQITIGGWDNHTGIYAGNNLNPAAPNSVARRFDKGLGELLFDLNQAGLLNDTLVIAQGEFGRTVGASGNLNGQAGRDHFLQQGVFVAGGGINAVGGRAIGTTPEPGGGQAPGSITVDPGWERGNGRVDPTLRPPLGKHIRNEDLEATIHSALGIDYTKVLYDDPLRRGFEYVPFADPELLSNPYLYGPIYELWQ